MAKLGEGDQRWIVQERSDGTNVHNWHWVERDSLEWARGRLTSLIGNLVILSGEGSCWVNTSEPITVEGEAYINVRKGKIIPGYELSVKVPWRGEIRSSDSAGKATEEDEPRILGVGSGIVEFPYVSDENAADDPEIRITVRSEDPSGVRLKEALLAAGKPIFLQRIKTFVEDMAAGGPAKDELAGKLNSKAVPAKGKGSAPTVVQKGAEDKVAVKKKPIQKESKKGRCRIEIMERFHCRKEDIFEVFVDERRWMAFSQSKASIEAKTGGSFSLFDGSVAGTFKKLEAPSEIVQQWRFNNWGDGIFSTVSITLDEPEVGLTILKLVHTDIPEEDRFGNATVKETTERGWRDLIFMKIKAVFGFGI